MSGNGETVSFTAPLLMWHSEGHGGIGYVAIEGEAADAIGAHELVRRLELGKRRGFGSVKVEVRVGGSRWSTSAFPQKGGGWFLPMKRTICRTEMLDEGDPVRIELTLL